LLGTVVILSASIWFLPYHCNSDSCLEYILQTKTVLVKNIPILVTVADTEIKRERGLSGRNELKENEGMLFVFKSLDISGFWMKDMKFSIDIVWIRENKIVSIEKNVSPNSFPNVFYPSEPASLVLELPSGFCDAHGVLVGDSLIGLP